MKNSFIRRKITRRVYRRMHEMNAFWKRNAWKIKPFLNEDLFHSLRSAFGAIGFAALFTGSMKDGRQWGRPYPQIFLDFINFLHENDFNFSTFSYPLYPDEYIMDLFSNACFLIERAIKCSRIERNLERLYETAHDAIEDVYAFRGTRSRNAGREE